MKTTTIRLPRDLHNLATTEARRAGVSTSEWIRQAIAVRAAWTSCTRAIDAGATTTQLRDFPWLCTILTDATNITAPQKPAEMPPP